jgi:pimeloyl-ACP methyl ester carboxylesterase
LFTVAAAAAASYVAFLCALFFRQGSIIYPGAQIAVGPAPPEADGVVPLKIATSQGGVEALFLPAPSAGVQQPVVVFAHGNGEVIDYWISALHGFQERGIGVLLVEYPGYGRSTGSPSERSIRAAMDAAYDRIAADPRVDRNRIFGFGQSLGGGAICLLARDRPLRALILQSTFTSLDSFTTRYWAPSFLLRDHFDNLSSVRHFPGPVLLIHGREDPVIPWQQGQQLAAASPHSTFKLYDCGHVCWDPEHLPFWQDVMPFLLAADIVTHAHVARGSPKTASVTPAPMMCRRAAAQPHR